MILQTRGLAFRHGERRVLTGIDLAVGAGELVALVGVNGSGKSTLLRLLAGLLAPEAGAVELDGVPLARLSRRRIARRVAVMHQTMPPVPGLTVRRLVRQGRYPTEGPLGMLRQHGHDARTDEAMELTGVAHLADRVLDTLSGGERQRVRLALALAQNADVLLLDEPTAHLDVRHQLEMLALVRDLRAARSLTVVTVLHELDHAARFTERVVALHRGAVHADGPPAEVITPGLLAEVFGVAGRVAMDDVHGTPHCVLDHPLDPDDAAAHATSS
ncbi:ABC transporter ATP-binding protein [Actinomadura hibisca]|uniref:ABC transporter ATP-binding protein n=1 Tax=Actinomadura hibisca TaxID=68565 RepID=UPI000830864A|nr:ABC transporter ATP-binding protein [Actinomadura hibisca]